MQKKKILFIVQLPPPVHGVTTINQGVVYSLAINEKFVVDVFPLKFSSTFQDMYGGEFKKTIRGIKTAFLLVKKLFLSRPEMVYFTLSPVGGAFLRDSFFVAIVKIFRVPIVYHLHGKGIGEKSKNRILKPIYKFVFKKVKVIHLSSLLFKDIEKFVAYDDCFFVPNGISAPCPFEKAGNDFSIDPPVIGYLANMNPKKGIYDLLDGFMLLQRKGVKAKLVLAGEWSPFVDKEKLQKYISDNGGDLTNINMLGPLYGEDKNAFFKQLNIFAYPTCHDAFPLVVLEAMSYGLPIVTTTEGAIPEMVQDGINGQLVPHHSPVKIFDALEKLIVNPELMNKYGKTSSENFKEKFTFDKFESNLCKILDHLLSTEHDSLL